MSLTSLLPSKYPKPKTCYKVRMTAPTKAKPLNEKSRMVEPGDEFICDQQTAAMLHGKCKILERIDSKDALPLATEREITAPKKIEGRSLPEELKELPECFAKAWTHLDQLRVKREEKAAAEKAFSNFTLKSGTDEESARVRGRLEDNMDQARERWKGHDRAPLVKELTEASRIVLDEYQAEQNEIHEIERMAHEAFAIRLSPLGLGESKVGNLFSGSDLCRRFTGLKVGLPFTVRQGFDPAGNRFFYADGSIEQLARTLREIRARRENLKQVRKEVETEIKQARKVLSAA